MAELRQSLQHKRKEEISELSTLLEQRRTVLDSFRATIVGGVSSQLLLLLLLLQPANEEEVVAFSGELLLLN